MTITAPVSTVTAAVECVDLSYQFATHLAVDHVNLSIAPGEMYGLLGPNGAGKTTTIRMITTLLTPGTGSVRVFGIDAAVRPMHVRRVIGYVPQALSADANLTGVENVDLFARLFDVPRRVRKQRVDEALSAMGLTEAASRLAGTYSGGDDAVAGHSGPGGRDDRKHHVRRTATLPPGKSLGPVVGGARSQRPF